MSKKQTAEGVRVDAAVRFLPKHCRNCVYAEPLRGIFTKYADLYCKKHDEHLRFDDYCDDFKAQI